MKKGKPIVTGGLKKVDNVKLIDGVRGKFINDLADVVQTFKHKRTFTLNTKIIKELLEKFLVEELDLFLRPSLREDRAFIAEYLAFFIFQDFEEEVLLEEFDITKSEFTNSYHCCLRGFKQLYSEEYS